MKRVLLAAAILGIAAAILVALTIPPARLLLPNPNPDGSVPGILHVHTNRSDGQSGVDDIAAAAARAGLEFVVFTDHGDATAPREAPAYRSGVLCIDAVEISTAGGHYIAIDMPAAPYPLAGEPRDVVEDVRRLGGFGIVAHPDSPKPDLRWQDPTLPFDAIETTNLDSGWRTWVKRAMEGPAADSSQAGSPSAWQARGRLAAALLDYPFRPAETIATLMPRDAMPSGYHDIIRRRRVVSIAGADAHAKLLYRDDGTDTGASLPIPGYEPTFRAMSVHVTPERPFSGDAAADTRLLLDAIRVGRVYTAVDAIATPASISFTATNESGTAAAGDELVPAGPVTLRVRTNAPPGFTATVWTGGTVLSADHQEQEFSVQAPPEPAAYWVSVVSNREGFSGATWLRTNPIYVRTPEAPAAAPSFGKPEAAAPLFDGESEAGWRIEHDPNSEGAIDIAKMADGPELRFRYALAGRIQASQFVGLVHDTPGGVTAADRLAFTARAEHPMRISVQLRVPDPATGTDERWQRSVYVDAERRDYTLAVDDFTPVGTTRAPKPSFADVRSLLFVIDTVNTKPGSAGRVWLSKVELRN